MKIIQNKTSSSIIVAASFCLFLAIASRGLTTGYSYWLDELYSASASSDGWGQLLTKWILPDVHPPLYQIALKIWVQMFGSSEISTRLMSFIFCLLTILLFSVEAIKSQQSRRFAALLLIASSPSVSYYSQETRSYAMMLMLASLTTLLSLKIRINRDRGSSADKKYSYLYYLSAFCLSLTHYFGWIYVFSIAIISFLERVIEPRRWKTILFVLAISVWPVYHILFGDLKGKTGGAFWIKVQYPVIGTINEYLSGCIPPLQIGDSKALFIVCWSLLIVLSLIVFATKNNLIKFFSFRDLSSNPWSETKFLFFSIATVLLIVSLIDIHTPMSTPRNYIVLLPPTMLLISNLLSNLSLVYKQRFNLSRTSALFSLSVLTILLLTKSWSDISSKISPLQNWKQLIYYTEKSRVCAGECFAIGGYRLQDFYLKKNEFTKVNDLSHLSFDDQRKMILNNPEVPVLFFQGALDKYEKENFISSGKVCLQPPQAWKNSTAIILGKNKMTGLEKDFGLTNCNYSS